MSFSINTKLSFIDSFQVLSFLFDSLVNNWSKVDYSYLSQKFDSNVLDLIKQKGFYPYRYISDFEKFKEQLTAKISFIARWKVKK